MIEGFTRVSLGTVLIAVVLAAFFHRAYSAVAIGKDLLLVFAFAAFLIACGIELIIRIVRNSRRHEPTIKP